MAEYNTSCIVGPGEELPPLEPPNWLVPQQGIVVAWRFVTPQPHGMGARQSAYELIVKNPPIVPPGLEGESAIPVDKIINFFGR